MLKVHKLFKKHEAFLILIIFSIGFYHAEAQDKITITGTYDNSPLLSVIKDIEDQSKYKFFYIEDWLKQDSISVSIADMNLRSFLDQILSQTVLNYYIIEEEKKVFLLENNVIYDELPRSFFAKRNDTIVSSSSFKLPVAVKQPTFFNDDIRQQRKSFNVVKIGKASGQNTKNSYLLTGSAFNAATGEPIPDLAIRVANTNLITVTNSNGNYKLEIPAGYNVLLTNAMGIEDSKREVIIYADGELNFELDEGLERLDEVIVEADAASNVEDANTGSEQINSEESKNIPLVLGERDILQIAKALPGISSAGEGATGLNVRGGKTDQNLVLLDDAVIYNPTHFFGIFQALNPFTTKGVDIYKGSMPVEYGGRLSSVFDIRTKNGDVNKIAGEGSVGPVTANLALEVPIKEEKSSFIMGARGAYADWILRSLDEESLNNSKASFFDGIIKYYDKIDETNEISASGYYSRDNFSITSDSLYNYSNRLFSVRWNRKINEKTSSALFLGNSNYQFGIDFDGESNTDFELDYRINETALKYKIQNVVNEKHLLNYGVSSKFYFVNPGSINPTGNSSNISAIEIAKETALEGALFIGDEIKLNDKLLVDVGLRYAFFAVLGESKRRTYVEGQPKNESTVIDTISYGSGELVKFYGGPELRLSARYLITPDLSIKASVNNANQFLHTLSNNTTVSPIDTWKLSDSNIESQKAYQGSLGIYKNFKENEYELSLEGYYRKMENVLDFKTGANLFLNENVETEVLQGDGKAYGIELLLRKNSGNLNGWLGYTYSRSLYRFDSEFSEERINNGEFFPSNFDKPHDVSLILNYKLTRRYSLSTNFVYQTGRPVTFPIGTFRFNNADFVAFSDRNAFRIPDYFRLDFGVNIEGNHKKKKLAHGFWTLSVYNVLGRNNPYSVFFVTEDGEVKALQSSIFAIPVPSITYNFKF